jgi:2,4-dienoyl-CoA reductase-like NADH-dependent reductase (Old Yellow Enzyme family)/thioredoxin reductase
MKLLDPISIGSMQLKNRIVMPAMVTNFASDTGAVTERLVTYHITRAKGSVALIIVEAACVESNLGRLVVNQLRVDSDKFLPGLAELTEAVHLHGAKIALQIHHAGRQTTLEATEGRIPVSASDVPFIDKYGSGTIIVKPRPLTIEEISDLVEKFGDGARRAKAAGFDAVEVHGAHGYLIGQFLSPYTNRRNDAYGGSFEGRMRFALEVVQRVKEKVGPGYPISFRISADEFTEGGMTLELAKRISVELEKAGVSVIHVSGSTGDAAPPIVAPMAVKRGYMVHLAEGVKAVVDVPVITVGRINDPELAEKILQEGKADLVAMGRGLIADPQLPLKTIEGRFNEIRKCIACNYGCEGRQNAGLRISCNINPEVGKEKEYTLILAEKTKKILIAGGGLAGMEAARIAALRGHQVTLYEKAHELGGQFILASKPPHKEELQNILEYYRVQMEKLKMAIELRKELVPKLVDEESPDAVIVATGAIPYIPDILGIENKCTSTAWDVLAGTTDVTDETVIIGGGEVGCETAEYLSQQGKRVTLVETLGDLALDMEPLNRYLLLQRLKEKEVRVLTRTSLKEILSDGVVVSNNSEECKLEAGSVVLALGAKSDNRLAQALKGKVKELYVIGDCVKPRKSFEAIREGSWVARLI